MPKILPDARILLFEYNSQVGASGAAALGVSNHADSLLDYYRALKVVHDSCAGQNARSPAQFQ
jgi:hypothetical protein